MMGSFLERPLIQKDFNANYQILVTMCDRELDSAKIIFDDQLARANTPQGVHNIECVCVCVCVCVCARVCTDIGVSSNIYQS